MTSIGSVTLDNDMVWENEFDFDPVQGNSVRTLGGGVAIQEYGLSEKGRLIRLASGDTIGFQKRSTVEALRALAAGVYDTFTLTIQTGATIVTKTVRFCHEADGGAVNFRPYVDRGGIHGADIYYSGTINLMVV